MHQEARVHGGHRRELAMSSMVVDINKEVGALQSSKATKDGKLQDCKTEVEACKDEAEAFKARIKALEAQLKVCMADAANGGSVQVSITLKCNAPRPPTFYGFRNAREIDDILWGLEAYFGEVGIEDDAQKVSNAAFSLKYIVFV